MNPISLKEQGNEEFQKGNYFQAIEFYTKAIVILTQQVSNDPNILYSNRAQCHRKLSDWKKCYQDALTAIEMEEHNIKAQMLCGQALLQLGKSENTLSNIENGLKRLTRAYSLCSSQNKRNFEKDIQTYIARGKKLLWYKKQELESWEKKELFQAIQKFEETNFKVPEEQKKNNLEELSRVLFDNGLEQSIPDFMIDPINNRIMKDPVILPSGNSFDNSNLQDYFKSNGYFDPLTKQAIDKNLVFKNLTLKKIIEEFMEV